jgi:hypothetical protein
MAYPIVVSAKAPRPYTIYDRKNASISIENQLLSQLLVKNNFHLSALALVHEGIRF